MTDFPGDRDMSDTAMALPDLTHLSVGEPVTSKKGGGIRICPILLDRKPLKLVVGTPDKPLRVPFHVQPFNADDTTTRLNLNLEIIDEQLQEFWRILDDKVLSEIETNSDLFRKPLTRDNLALMFRPTLPPNGKFQPILRVKIEIAEGTRRVRTWDSNSELVELPSDWKDLMVAAHVEIKGVWLSSSMLGMSLEATDVMLFDTNGSAECPFDF